MEKESDIGIIIGVGSLALVFLVLLMVILASIFKRRILEKERKIRMIEQQKQIDLFKAVAEAKENLKLKVSEKLHNEIVSMISFTSRSLSGHIIELEDAGASVEKLKAELESFESLSTRVREISHDMVPKLFTTFGLLKSVESVVKKINDSEGLTAIFANKANYADLIPFSSGEQLIIYEMTLEILNNLVKHSNFTLLTVSLLDMNQNFTLEFVHNGKQITNAEIERLTESGRGIGLKSLRSNALLLNAILEYSFELEVSYIKLAVPFKNEGIN